MDDAAWASDADWWRTAVVYEIYVRSFADSNADGVGDLPGVISRLDYLEQLGVEAIWLTPFYRSPMVDGGYDVSDHRDVDPRFGTLADVDRLITECHHRRIRVVVDVVANHSSDQHPWFQEALAAGPGSAARDRYVFRPGRGPSGELPPTDWQSWFHTSAWQRVDDGEWYLHLFDPAQPDLNWANAEVRTDFERTLRFWADRGVDGFRVDVAHGLAKDLTPLRDDGGAYPFRRHQLLDGTHPVYDRDEVHEIFRSWRRLFNEYDPPRAAVAEAVEGPRRTLYARVDELGQSFTFDLVALEWDAADWRRTIESCLRDAQAADTTCTWVLSNHDVVRAVSRYGLPRGTDLDAWKLSEGQLPRPDVELGRSRAQALALLMLALPGSAYLYQGEELGLPEVADLPRDRLDNAMWERSGHTRVGSDGCRVPLPWTASGPSLGFSLVAGWLPQPAAFAALAAEDQASDPTSTLSLYRRAVLLRRELAVHESFRPIVADAALVAFDRNGWECWTNFGDVAVPLPSGDIVMASTQITDRQLPPSATAWVARGLSATRWVTDNARGHSQRYVDRFRALAADGADLEGEARLVDAVVARRSRVLDAGCGSGRVAAALAARGHHVVGVDADPVLVEAARADHPDLTWVVGDLATLDLSNVAEGDSGGHERFDAAVLAGNVMVFLAPGTEPAVLARLWAHLVPDGVAIIGFATDRAYSLAAFDTDLAGAGLVLEHRFATWDLRPWRDDAPFAVSILRRP